MLHELQRGFVRDVARREPRLAVYAESRAGGLAEALAEVYPVCRALVGADFFDALALRFAGDTPSRSADLNDYGEPLADFLESFEPARALVYLPDVARLEWLCHRAFHAAGAPPFDLASLADVPAHRHGQLVFGLAPSVGLLRSPYPVGKIWQTHQAPEPEEREPGDEIDLDDGPEHCVVWRDGLEIRVDTLSSLDAWALLRACAGGVALEDAVAELDVPDELAELLRELVGCGWIAGFDEALTAP